VEKACGETGDRARDRVHDVPVRRDLGAPGAAVPPAVRSSSPGWRDPRLWVGVAIVAASVLVGVRVLDAADDTVQVWAVGDDAEPGTVLAEADLVARRLRFDDDADLERYYEVGAELPAELTLVRGLGGGELLPRSAVGAVDDDGTVTLSIAVGPLLAPTGIGPGSVVDVHVTGEPDGSEGRTSPPATGEPVLDDVRVVAATAAGDATSPGGERQVELAVPRDDVGAYFALVDGLAAPVVSLVQES
jgi:hypothetical protein